MVRCVDCNFCCHEKCAPIVRKDCRGRPPSMNGSVRHRNHTGVTNTNLPGTGSIRPWNRPRARTEDRNLHESSTEPESLAVPTPYRFKANGLSSSGASSLYDVTGASNGKKNGGDFSSHSIASSATNSPQVTRGTINAISATQGGSIAFCGELYKLSSRKVLASWKSRFFVLDTEHHQMRYYDTPQDEVPRGCIDLQDVRAVRLLKNTTSVPRRFQDSCTFEIDTTARQFRFAADNAKAASAWVERLQSTII
ncbi:unnamed protein product [Rodentolepis nana]|uniref:PH domain-containing protein n=1 Tax=Rodentolepis nana TaxID=102285 RepID=A0A3P7SMV4_RODNA|nr:unnamed protein product [Rodentolepis nana]